MTTPNKRQIVEKATELWRTDRAKANDASFTLTPEVSELREGGYLSVARSELMTGTERKNEQRLNDSSVFQFDVSEALANGIYTAGSRGCGKSDINMMFAEKLQKQGIIVIVFDPSLDWVKRSNIQKYVTVQTYTMMSVSRESMIYDLSLLTLQQQKRVVESFNRVLFEHQIQSAQGQWYFCIYEEAHQYFPQGCLRSKNMQYSVRLLTQGRNFRISMALITQFSSMIDKDAMKFMNQRFFGVSNEPNDVEYLKGFLGKDAEQLKTFESGTFFYFNKGKVSKIGIEPYESDTQKVRIIQPEPIPSVPTQPITPKEQISIISLLKLGMIACFVVLLLGAIR